MPLFGTKSKKEAAPAPQATSDLSSRNAAPIPKWAAELRKRNLTEEEFLAGISAWQRHVYNKEKEQYYRVQKHRRFNEQVRQLDEKLGRNLDYDAFHRKQVESMPSPDEKGIDRKERKKRQKAREEAQRQFQERRQQNEEMREKMIFVMMGGEGKTEEEQKNLRLAIHQARIQNQSQALAKNLSQTETMQDVVGDRHTHYDPDAREFVTYSPEQAEAEAGSARDKVEKGTYYAGFASIGGTVVSKGKTVAEGLGTVHEKMGVSGQRFQDFAAGTGGQHFTGTGGFLSAGGEVFKAVNASVQLKHASDTGQDSDAVSRALDAGAAMITATGHVATALSSDAMGKLILGGGAMAPLPYTSVTGLVSGPMTVVSSSVQVHSARKGEAALREMKEGDEYKKGLDEADKELRKQFLTLMILERAAHNRKVHAGFDVASGTLTTLGSVAALIPGGQTFSTAFSVMGIANKGAQFVADKVMEDHAVDETMDALMEAQEQQEALHMAGAWGLDKKQIEKALAASGDVTTRHELMNKIRVRLAQYIHSLLGEAQVSPFVEQVMNALGYKDPALYHNIRVQDLAKKFGCSEDPEKAVTNAVRAEAEEKAAERIQKVRGLMDGVAEKKQKAKEEKDKKQAAALAAAAKSQTKAKKAAGSGPLMDLDPANGLQPSDLAAPGKQPAGTAAAATAQNIAAQAAARVNQGVVTPSAPTTPVRIGANRVPPPVPPRRTPAPAPAGNGVIRPVPKTSTRAPAPPPRTCVPVPAGNSVVRPVPKSPTGASVPRASASATRPSNKTASKAVTGASGASSGSSEKPLTVKELRARLPAVPTHPVTNGGAEKTKVAQKKKVLVPTG